MSFCDPTSDQDCRRIFPIHQIILKDNVTDQRREVYSSTAKGVHFSNTAAVRDQASMHAQWRFTSFVDKFPKKNSHRLLHP